nr:MAG TPA: hypothetical protein [Caudoviricetes sp.]
MYRKGGLKYSRFFMPKNGTKTVKKYLIIKL